MNPNFTDVCTQMFVMMLFFIYHDFNYIIVTGENPLETLCAFSASLENLRVFSKVLLIEHHTMPLVNKYLFVFFFFHQYYLLDTMSRSWSTGSFLLLTVHFQAICPCHQHSTLAFQARAYLHQF